MFFIKTCHLCGKKIRFPLDRGTIRVRCVCGNAFIADPDDPTLYKEGTFDLSYKKRSPRAGIADRCIRSLFNFKYRMQNFRLLPSSEQRKIIFLLSVIFGFAVLILMVLMYGDI